MQCPENNVLLNTFNNLTNVYKIDQTVVLQDTKIRAAPYSIFTLTVFLFLISMPIYTRPILQPVYSIFVASVLTMTNVAVCQQTDNIIYFQWKTYELISNIMINPKYPGRSVGWKNTRPTTNNKNAISLHAIFWTQWSLRIKSVLKTSQGS